MLAEFHWWRRLRRGVWCRVAEIRVGECWMKVYWVRRATSRWKPLGIVLNIEDYSAVPKH